MKRIITATIFSALIYCTAFSQNALNPGSIKALDAGLNLMAMQRSDLYLPGDYRENDYYRLKLIKSFFDNPLLMFDKGKEYQDMFLDIQPDNLHKAVEIIAKDLELQPLKEINLSMPYNSEDIDKILKVKLDSLMGVFENLLLMQYLAPILRANEAMFYDGLYKDIKTKKYLIENINSLMSEDAESSPVTNVFEAQEAQYKAHETALKFFSLAHVINSSDVHSIGLSLYKKLLLVTSQIESNLDAAKGRLKTTIVNTRIGRIGIGGFDNDVYTGDFFLIIDLGGDDVYNLDGILPQSQKRNINSIIDLEGNDIYKGGDNALGGALFGVSLLIDKKGNDNYTGGSNSLGSAIYGFGLLHDIEGMDSYSAKSYSQGSGSFGIGLLIDNEGADSYKCESYSQGFGYVKGFGFLADLKGNDVYTSLSPSVDVLRYDDHFISFAQGASIGYRPIASGGIGILSDYSGNDNYISDIYGQGTAYWFSFGALLDNSGDDRYQSYQYAQGSGVHFAHAYLHDLKGNDVYVSHGVSQGCGHDIASGILLDEDGDDQYLAESLSMGAGNANAISILLDLRGNDAYFSVNGGNSMGFSDFRRGYGMIGLFYDAGGKDHYGAPQNDFIKLKSTSGAMADAELNLEKAPQDMVIKNGDKQLPLANGIDSLFAQASASHLRFQYNVEPARKKISEMGAKAFPFLSAKFNTDFPRERLALEEIFLKMFDKDSLAVLGLVKDSLGAKSYRTKMLMLEIAGRKKLMPASESISKLLEDKDWRVRASAAHKLGLTEGKQFADAIAKLLDDENPLPRAYAAYSLAALKYPKLKEHAGALFNDQNQIVRTNFLQGIIISSIEFDDFEFYTKLDIDDYYKNELAKGLNLNKMSEEKFSDFKKKFKNLNKEQRRAVYLNLLESKEEHSIEKVKALVSKSEKDKELQKLIFKKIETAE